MPSASTGRGFHGGDSTVSRTTSGMSSRRNPSDSRLEGAPIARAKSKMPVAGSETPSAAATRTIASGAACWL